jgi:hypothetical protein
MPFPPVTPFLTAGAGSTIPISAGGGTSGDVQTDIGPISVGGLFGSDAQGTNGISPQMLLIAGVAVFAGLILLRKL